MTPPRYRLHDEVDWPLPLKGTTPLLSAASGGHVEVCKLLLDSGEWVQNCMGRDREKKADGYQIVLSLNKAANLLLPKDEITKALLANAHTAGADAELHRLLFGAMVKLKDEALGRA